MNRQELHERKSPGDGLELVPPHGLCSAQPGEKTEIPSWISVELVEKTLEIWQPYYSYQLTPDDALAIIKSVGDLFEVLSRGTD